jgi:hypothetical protein
MHLIEQEGAHEAKDHREVRGHGQAERAAADRGIREAVEHTQG